MRRPIFEPAWIGFPGISSSIEYLLRLNIWNHFLFKTLDLRPVSAADTDEACPVAKGHGGRAQQDVLKVAPSGILGIRRG